MSAYLNRQAWPLAAMSFLILVIVVLSALALQGFDSELKDAVVIGDLASVTTLLRSVSPEDLPSAENLFFAYSRGHVDIIEAIVEYIQSANSPEITTLVYQFLMKLCQPRAMSFTHPHRERIVDLLVPFTVDLDRDCINRLVKALHGARDWETLAKLKDAQPEESLGIEYIDKFTQLPVHSVLQSNCEGRDHDSNSPVSCGIDMYSVESEPKTPTESDEGAVTDSQVDSVIIDGLGSWEHVQDSLSAIGFVHTLYCFNLDHIPPIDTRHLILRDVPGLQEINAELFRYVPSLRQLTLSDLHISTIHSHAFDWLPRLSFIDLSNNNLLQFPQALKSSSLLHIDVTGNPMIRGCIPSVLIPAVVPVQLLPSCEFRLDSINRQALGPYPENTELLFRQLKYRFKCSDRPYFLTQLARHVYKVRLVTGSHYGLVFVFDHGLMLSELGNSFSGKLKIYSTCVEIERDLEHESQLVTLMFTRNSPFWRDRIAVQARDEFMYDVRTHSYEDMGIPEESGITGAHLIAQTEEYQRTHTKFAKKFDSCITFAHVLYRDLLL